MKRFVKALPFFWFFMVVSGVSAWSGAFVTVPCADGEIRVTPVALKPFRRDVGSCAVNCMRKVKLSFHETNRSEDGTLSIQVNSVDCATTLGGTCQPPFADFSSEPVVNTGAVVHTRIELLPDPCLSYTLNVTCAKEDVAETVSVEVTTRAHHGTSYEE